MPYEESELEFASGIGEPPAYAKKLMAEVRGSKNWSGDCWH